MNLPFCCRLMRGETIGDEGTKSCPGLIGTDSTVQYQAAILIFFLFCADVNSPVWPVMGRIRQKIRAVGSDDEEVWRPLNHSRFSDLIFWSFQLTPWDTLSTIKILSKHICHPVLFSCVARDCRILLFGVTKLHIFLLCLGCADFLLCRRLMTTWEETKMIRWLRLHSQRYLCLLWVSALHQVLCQQFRVVTKFQEGFFLCHFPHVFNLKAWKTMRNEILLFQTKQVFQITQWGTSSATYWVQEEGEKFLWKQVVSEKRSVPISVSNHSQATPTVTNWWPSVWVCWMLISTTATRMFDSDHQQEIKGKE